MLNMKRRDTIITLIFMMILQLIILSSCSVEPSKTNNRKSKKEIIDIVFSNIDQFNQCVDILAGHEKELVKLMEEYGSTCLSGMYVERVDSIFSAEEKEIYHSFIDFFHPDEIDFHFGDGAGKNHTVIGIDFLFRCSDEDCKWCMFLSTRYKDRNLKSVHEENRIIQRAARLSTSVKETSIPSWWIIECERQHAITE